MCERGGYVFARMYVCVVFILVVIFNVKFLNTFPFCTSSSSMLNSKSMKSVRQCCQPTKRFQNDKYRHNLKSQMYLILLLTLDSNFPITLQKFYSHFRLSYERCFRFYLSSLGVLVHKLGLPISISAAPALVSSYRCCQFFLEKIC